MKPTDPNLAPARPQRIGPSMPFREAAGRRLGLAPVLAGILGFLGCLYAVTAPTRALVDAHPRQQFNAGLWTDQNLGAYQELKGEVKGLFLGSSRVVRGVMPSVFSNVMGRKGLPMRTLNMGNAGMNFVEQAAFVDKLIQWDLEGVEWIVFELNEFDPRFGEQNRRSPRLIGWHTPSATFDMLAILWGSERGWLDKIQASYGHLVELACHLGGAGQVHSYWKNNYGEDWQRSLGKVARAYGYNKYSKQKVVIEKGFAKLSRPEAPRPDRAPGITPAHRRLLAEVDRKLRSIGVLPIFLRMPGFRRECGALEAVRQGILPCLIDAHEDERFKPVFERENFYDRIHLNDQGAQVFSRILARAVVSIYHAGLVDELEAKR